MVAPPAPTRSLSVPISGFGAPPGQVSLQVQVLSLQNRLKRAGKVLALCWLVALIALPIPLVHLVLVPAAIMAGLGLFILRLGHTEVFEKVQGTCPFCHTPQTFGLFGRFKLPKQVACKSCRRPLTIGGEQSPPSSLTI